jgi:four helix bundle protein
MSFAERFEDLRIWQEARAEVSAIYHSLKQGTAGHSDLGSRTQIQRAAVSVMNNIAEGFERKTRKASRISSIWRRARAERFGVCFTLPKI